jgi:hypothetical protein
MATSAGPNLEGVKNNDLLLSFDAHDAKSYPGEPTMNMVQLPNNLTATSNWNVTNGTLANDQIDGPNGRKAGSLTATNSDPYIYSSFIFTVETGSLTFSAYVKGSSDSIGMGGDIRINFGTSAGQATGSNTTSNYTITGDWQRVSVTATVTGAGTIKVGVEAPNSATAGQVVFIADMQLEQKHKATPFVVGPNPNDTGTYMGRPATVDFMLHGNVGTGTTFSDSGANALTITNTNSVGHSAVSKFNGGSIKFVRSSSQVLTTASTSAGDFGTGDWTIDFWFNMTSGQTDRMHAFNVGTGSTANINFDFNDGNAFWLYWNSSGSPKISFGSDGDYGDGQWHHCAATRYNGMVRVWIDGSHKGSNNYNSSTSMGQTASLYIGAVGSGGSYYHHWDGYLDEIRVVKGTALWKGSNDFVPPTRRGAGGPLIDRSQNLNDATFVNGAGVEATGPTTRRDGQVILPTSSTYLDFDGSDDYASIAYNSSLNTPVGATFALWVYFEGDGEFLSRGTSDSGSTPDNPRLHVTTSVRKIYFDWSISGTDSYVTTSNSAYPSNSTWVNIVASAAAGGMMRVYVNGSESTYQARVNADSLPNPLVNNNNPLQLGGATWIPRYFTGRIAAFQMYNKELTAAQIKQNFNQQRSRFKV